MNVDRKTKRALVVGGLFYASGKLLKFQITPRSAAMVAAVSYIKSTDQFKALVPKIIDPMLQEPIEVGACVYALNRQEVPVQFRLKGARDKVVLASTAAEYFADKALTLLGL